MNVDSRILVIFDVDETLVYSSEKPIGRDPEFICGPYCVYVRPGLSDFLLLCNRSFQLAIWSSSTADYLQGIVAGAFPPDVTLRFVWGRERCVTRLDPERQEPYFVKDLKKAKRLGFELRRILIIEDTPQKVERSYGNAIYVRPYFGDASDVELERLGRYLESIRDVEDVRSIEKRGWRTVH